MMASPKKIPVYPLSDYDRSDGEETRVFVKALAESFAQHPNRYQLHRHDFFEIFLVEGEGSFFADFKEHPFSGLTLIVVSAGQVHGWKHAGRLDGVMAGFSREFFEGETGGLLAGFPMVFNPETTPMPVADAPREKNLRDVATRMAAEYAGGEPGWKQAVRACLMLMLTDAGRLHPKSGDKSPPGRADRLVSEFRLLVENRFRTDKSVAAYARLLKVTPGHLNDTVKERTGSVAGDLLRERVLLEAKRLLLHSQLGIAEIAYHLGYEDPSYFARTFRREVGTSPADFRDSAREKYRS